MKLRWWPHTPDPRVASTRLRCLQVINALQQAGIDAGLYAPSDPAPDVLVLAKRYDSASIAKARALRDSGTRLVLDLCDNHFHCDPPTPFWTHRANMLRHAVASVDAITVSTPTLADVVYSESDDTPPVYVIGDAVELPWAPGKVRRWSHPFDEWALSRLAARNAKVQSSGGVALLWFGNHGIGNAEGGMRDLLNLRQVLLSLHRQQRACLTVISNHRGKFRSVARELSIPSFYLPWRASTFSRAVSLHDIALLPISPNPFTLCKTNNRVATALVHGVAVAADSIPSYAELSHSIVLGDWEAGLQKLAADAPLRQAMVERGKEYISAHWNLAQIVEQWMATLFSVAQMGADQLPTNPPNTGPFISGEAP